MTEIGLLKAAGAVAFTDGDKSVTNAQVMRRALTYARDFDALIVHHTEDPDLVGEGVMNEGEFATRLGLVGIPNAAEAIMLERDMRLVGTDRRALPRGLADLASSRSKSCKRARDAGLDVSASVSINHLTLNENDIGPYRTFLKLSPPLRTEEDRLALVAAVASGLIDVIMSDHNPQDVEVKRLPFAEAARRRHRPARPCCRRAAADPQWRAGLHDADPRDVDPPGRTARPAGRHAAPGVPRPTSS